MDTKFERNRMKKQEFLDNINNYIYYINNKIPIELIREFKNKFNWDCISQYQKLTMPFIREFKDLVDWDRISIHQKLTIPFIREFKNRVDWYYISRYQKLTMPFIREFKDRVNWYYISAYQKLSMSFIREFKLGILKDNWLYWPKEKKIKAIKKAGFKIKNNIIHAWKSIREDRYSQYNFIIKYSKGKLVRDKNCDCNSNDSISFGLSAWNKKNANKISKEDGGVTIPVRIGIDDFGCVTGDGKIRCFALIPEE
jgi:hypothetical protein